MSEKSFYITTPIYYINDKPHIGHSYTIILADVLARYHRLCGDPVFFLTGTDEHGQKVQQAAEKSGISPQEQADKTVVRFQELWKTLLITHDDFIRTTQERHTKIVQAILQQLFDRDEVYKAEYDGWYDVTSETFVTEREMEEAESSKIGSQIIKIKESNYFFRMSKYQDWLIQYIEENLSFIQPDFRRNETMGFLRKELNDLCISRPKSRLSWGIELPFDSAFVTYVWFDALVNYISAIGYLKEDADFKKWWPASCHIIAKDILTPHTVYWPAMLKAMELPLPQSIFVHGYWLMGDTKMSKSLGNIADPLDLIDRYGYSPDALRYLLVAEMTQGQDSTFSEAGFARRYNADLANDLGNLLSRILNMLSRYCDGKIPEVSAEVIQQGEEKELWSTVRTAADQMDAAMARIDIGAGLTDVLTAVRVINRYLEVKAPWNLTKNGDQAAVDRVLYMAAEALRACSALLFPVMPEKMTELRVALGLTKRPPNARKTRDWGQLKGGKKTGAAKALFPRIEKQDKPEDILPEQDKKGKSMDSEKVKKKEETNLISYDDFCNVELRTAKILEAEKIENTEKLIRLEVMMGEERRQLVAGIALYYNVDELIGKTVVVVANLKPVKLKGVESQGMVLAASKGESLRLITVDGELSSGAEVK